MRIKKLNAIFGKYPCCDLLNRALRFLLDGKPEQAKEDIILAIGKADGYFYEDVAEKLGIVADKDGRCFRDTNSSYNEDKKNERSV